MAFQAVCCRHGDGLERPAHTQPAISKLPTLSRILSKFAAITNNTSRKVDMSRSTEANSLDEYALGVKVGRQELHVSCLADFQTADLVGHADSFCRSQTHLPFVIAILKTF